MTNQTDRMGWRQQSGWLLVGSCLMIGAATWFAVKLSTDDCRTVTTKMPDGSQIERQTCS